MYLELLSKSKKQHPFKLFSYVLLPDHLHLLIELKEGVKLSVIMHNLNSSYTKYFNSKYHRKGHLFRERFKATIVEKEPYLLRLSRYIHLNPKRLNLVSDIKDYPYSSYHLYICSEQGNAIVGGNEIEEVLSELKEKKYEDFVAEALSDESETLYKGLHRGGILGSDEFISQIKEKLSEYKDKTKVEDEKAPGIKKDRLILFYAFIFLSLSALSVLYFYRAKTSGKETGAITTGIIVTELKGTEWEITLVPAIGEGVSQSDTLNFNGRFTSRSLLSKGYPSSNYTLHTEEDKRLVWETMQTSEKDASTVSWRGEVEQGKMKGIVSMSPAGSKSQDFSFVSVGYRRKR